MLTCKPPRKLSTKRKQDDVVADSATALHPFFTQQSRTPAVVAEKPLDNIAAVDTTTILPEKSLDDIAAVDTTTMETTLDIADVPPMEKRVKTKYQRKHLNLKCPCPGCENRSFRRHDELRNHTNWVHLGLKKPKHKVPEKKHKCLHIGCEHKIYTSPGRLRMHDDFAHAGIFNFVCNHIDDVSGIPCGYVCERNGDLSEHCRIHADVRPYKCNECSFASKTLTNLNQHWVFRHGPDDHPVNIKLHAKSFQCEDCDKAFGTNENRRCHRMYHHTPEDDPERIAFMAMRRDYMNALYANSPEYRLRSTVRHATSRLLASMGLTKNAKSVALLGCTYDDALEHLNNNDRGLIFGDLEQANHVDHVKPLASFKLGCRVELLKAANFNNLQLLPGPENLSKSDRFTPADALAYAASAGGKAIAELEIGWRAAGVCECPECVL
ncbi:hypothetical protein T484DRAFT_1757765 [Baffinella frigidus]|nr:hypothetical protein T484DRAFT_1757765 [Cryptophyta sp. CCMP2293]